VDSSGFLNGFAASARSANTVHPNAEKYLCQGVVIIDDIPDEGVFGDGEIHAAVPPFCP
jgi:hypothetical protein